MYSLILRFLHINSLIPFSMFLFVIALILLRNKINKKVWSVLCFVPLLISVIHLIVFNLHAAMDFIIEKYIYMYLFSLLILIFPLLSRKQKVFKICSIITVVLGISCYLYTFYSTLPYDGLHNLTYDSYTKSFKKTIQIMKKEYVLSEHKKIDYDALYEKYYPSIKKAEEEKDEQLYFKTMFEFSKNFYDGHVSFSVYFTDLEEGIKKYEFINDYANRNYGFASILLSNGDIVSILVDEDSDAYRQGLRDGMILTKKDNIDIHEALDNIITPIDAYPVLEDDNLIKSFYLFSTGNSTISLSFINDSGGEITINVPSKDTENDKPEILWDKIINYMDKEHLETEMLDNNTGYIYIAHESYNPFKAKISSITDDASYLTKVVDKKLGNLKEQGMENLIIDLRGNEGGYFQESAAIASLFTSDSYLAMKSAKNNSKLYDKFYLRSNGKYEDMKVYVLVNADTASAGDLLTNMLLKCKNVFVMGFTNPNNSAQSTGGIIYLSGGTSLIAFPNHTSRDSNNNILVDTDSFRIANVKVDYRVPLTQENIIDIVNSEEGTDYLLDLALEMIG